MGDNNGGEIVHEDSREIRLRKARWKAAKLFTFVGLAGAHIILSGEAAKTREEIRTLARTPVSYRVDANKDGRQDIQMNREFGNVVYLALKDGKYDKCTDEGRRFVSHDKQRIYFEGGLFIDKDKDLIGDTSSGLVTRLNKGIN